MNDILAFNGEYRWLSNFYAAPVMLDGHIYPSVENAYQAATAHPSLRGQFRNCSSYRAKQLGRTIELHENWYREKVQIMRDLLAQKFDTGSELANKLKATGTCQIVEGNTWGDVFWGICNGHGENHLGRLLMERRDILLQNEQQDSKPL